MRNYNDISFVLNMEIEDFVSQFVKLKEKDLENKVWELWLAKFPLMTKDNYISYEEMLNTAKQQEIKHIDNVEMPANGCYVDQVFF